MKTTIGAKELANDAITKVSGKIILIDDERCEKDLLIQALEKKHWYVNVEYFSNGQDALDYMLRTNDELFLVISDMNMPGMSGIDLKKAMDKNKDLREKSMPFIFMSGTNTRAQVSEAYEYRVQGYFEKPNTIAEEAAMLDLIIKYWIVSLHPKRGIL